ncbi:unnamed protein product [[Candida] boidinii]|uniref:Unnamed protein product n=1 Tax=Candida boidinii TaxID=5477 RepID=A0ACB5TMC6_CANBO|nr:unnamed protein product [[Candida] boidinii]
MFYSEQLLSKDGPLAYVWLAANLERKLTKQQLLTASISDSTEAIASSSAIPTASKPNDISQSQITFTQRSQRRLVDSASSSAEPLALRLTGQLLYGVVRIYSRKAKYLFDDVTDALLKLKSAFKVSQSVILPAESTVISSLKTVTLQDTVTETDLLYQQPLNFELGSSPIKKRLFGSSQLPSGSQLNSSYEQDGDDDDYEQGDRMHNLSIELPRREEIDELARFNDSDGDEILNDFNNNDDDIDLDLNFDLGDASGDDFNNNTSALDIEVARANEDGNASDMPDLTADPLDGALEDFVEPVFDIGNNGDGASTPLAAQDDDEEGPKTPTHAVGEHNLQLVESISANDVNNQKKRKRQEKQFTNTSVVRTNNKKIVLDSISEISAERLRNFQKNYPPHPKNKKSDLIYQLKDSQKLDIIMNLSNPTYSYYHASINVNSSELKRRKLQADIKQKEHDDELEKQKQQSEENAFDEIISNENGNDDIDSGFGLDYDIASPVENDAPEVGDERIEPVAAGSPLEGAEEDDFEAFEDDSESYFNKLQKVDGKSSIAASTVQIASQLRDKFGKEKSDFNASVKCTFTEVMMNDIESEEPLSKNPKKEATRAFFELLVLGTHNAVELQQERLFGEITISGKEDIYKIFT